MRLKILSVGTDYETSAIFNVLAIVCAKKFKLRITVLRIRGYKMHDNRMFKI